MASHTSAASSESVDRPTSGISHLHLEGIVAGTIGAATIALWFLILDMMKGRPLHTPTVLGTALFRWREPLLSPESLPVSLEMVLMYTWNHWLLFCVIGGIASRI